MKRRVLGVILIGTVMLMGLAGCKESVSSSVKLPPESITLENDTKPSGENSSENITEESSGTGETEPSAEAPTTEAPTTPEPTTPEPATPEPTTPEPTTENSYVGAWTLLSSAPLNPTKSGYPELDTLIDDLLAKVVNDNMNGYKKAWACYEYLVDNITYNRGMDANTGMYSISDPAVTPKEVLWATDLLNTGMGCCYHFSSVYVYILRAIGYDAHLVSGNVPKYGGGVTPHCWLYVNLAGEQYIFDPDLDMNYYTRDKGNGVENPAKDRFFCVRTDKMSYFYKPVTYHTN